MLTDCDKELWSTGFTHMVGHYMQTFHYRKLEMKMSILMQRLELRSTSNIPKHSNLLDNFKTMHRFHFSWNYQIFGTFWCSVGYNLKKKEILVNGRLWRVLFLLKSNSKPLYPFLPSCWICLNIVFQLTLALKVKTTVQQHGGSTLADFAKWLSYLIKV